MDNTTLVFCVSEDRVLLGMKKRGFGAGKWNGYGGKMDEGEAARAAAVRELREESGLVAEERRLETAALIRFYFAGECKVLCRVFILKGPSGEPLETDEMAPQWFPQEQLPFDAMWAADHVWLPLIFSGKK